jgi:hypothetical protein
LVLCDFLVDDFLCVVDLAAAGAVESVVVLAAVSAWEAEAGAVWASTEPERATPATSREAIASLRIMIMSLENDLPRTRPEPGNSGGVTAPQCLGVGILELNRYAKR